MDGSDDEELWAEMREFWSDGELDDQDARSAPAATAHCA